MKINILSLLLLIPLLTIGQIPDSYSPTDVQKGLEYVDLLKEKWDIVIPIEERLPIAPTGYSLAQGNWGAEWAGTNKYKDEVYARAERKVIVFIFDTAPFFSHQMLNLFALNDLGRSYTGEPSFEDGQGHGHHVAGIIGGVSETTSIGVAAPLVEKGFLKGIPIEVLNDSGSGSFSWVEKAIIDAIPVAKKFQQDGAFVIFTLSLGGPGTHSGTEKALALAKSEGIFTTTAAGNTGKEGLQYPARSEEVYPIGAIGRDGRKASFSTYGDGLWMVGPGVGILSTWLNESLVEMSGTSMSTPLEAAMAAMAASIYPELDNLEVAALLEHVATDIDPNGWDIKTGFGYDYVKKILDYDLDNPDDPDQPDDPIREKNRRIVRLVLEGPFDFVYQSGEGLFVPASIENLIVAFKTRAYSEQALSDMEVVVGDFFNRRAITLTDKGDALRAGYWAGRFLEIYLKRNKIKANVVDMDVVDKNGNVGLPECPNILDYFRPSKRTTFTY